MPIKFRCPSLGVDLETGLIGAGKSYDLTEKARDDAVYQQRPVATNLPLRYKVIRKYLNLQGRGELARYIFPLQKDHVMRFIERNYELQQFTQTVKELGLTTQEIEGAYFTKKGPHVYFGKGANWFPPFTKFIADEAQHWFPQREQANEHPGVQAYFTMCRHHLHHWILATQDEMQVSLSIRRVCTQLIRAVDKRRFKFLWGWKLPIPLFFYEEWPGEVVFKSSSPFAMPSGGYMRCPLMNGYLTYRLYDSFSHVGSPRRLKRRLNEIRDEIVAGSFDTLQTKGYGRAFTQQEKVYLAGRAVGILSDLLSSGSIVPAGVGGVAQRAPNQRRPGSPGSAHFAVKPAAWASAISDFPAADQPRVAAYQQARPGTYSGGPRVYADGSFPANPFDAGAFTPEAAGAADGAAGGGGDGT